ncbi:MAG: hypothetical protein H0W64_00140 [Gammaproteobacteria bacterium]|nr:hypothetical protein [Gammaproteobacteria bacterium]
MGASGDVKRDYTYIVDVINQYNHLATKENAIQFILTHSSVLLAFMGKTTTVSHPKESRILMIPFSLIPYAQLRKKYGIYPMFSEQRLLTRGENFSPHHFLGELVTQKGIKRCYKKATDGLSQIQTNEFHKVIVQTILQMTPHNYIRSLKKLIVLLININFLDKTIHDKGGHYLTLLQNQKVRLAKSGVNAQSYFDKYYLRIDNILKSNLVPFRADEDLRAEIHDPYPIIFCTSVAPTLNNEQSIFQDELPATHIRLAFTPVRHVGKLETKLQELGLANRIQVHGFEINESAEQYEDIDPEVHAFTETKCWEDLNTLLEEKPAVLKDKRLLVSKINQCISAYLGGEELEALTMASWLFKKANLATLIEVYGNLSKHIDFVLQHHLHEADHDQFFQEAVREILSQDYLLRLQELAYLKAVIHLRQTVDSFEALCDYDKKLNYFELHEMIKPKGLPLSARLNYLKNYLLRLQSYYTLLNKDAIALRKKLDTIAARSAFVQNKYIELLEECEKDHGIDDQIKNSQLYREVKKTFPETHKKWFVMLFKGTRMKSKKAISKSEKTSQK